MTETETKPSENTKPQTESSQSVAVEDDHLFHPLEISEQAIQIPTEKEPEVYKAEVEQKLQDLLKNINEETTQLSRFLNEESKLMNELCSSLKQILKKLNVSFNIPPQGVPVKKKVKKVVLNEEGHLILVHEKGEVSSSFLGECQPEVVMAVLWIVVPELAKTIATYRKKIGTRISFFMRVKKELKNAVNAVADEKEKTSDSTEKQPTEIVKDSAKEEVKS